MNPKPINIAVLGDSHLGALKYAWDEIEHTLPDVHLTFFGALRKTFGNVVVRGRRIIPQDEELSNSIKRTSGGCSYIDIDRYDCFVVHGFGISLHKFLLNEVIRSQSSLDDVTPGRFEFFLNQSLGKMLADMILDLGKPVLLSPAPLTSEKAAGRPTWKKLQRLHQDASDDRISELMVTLDNFLARYDTLEQPESTRAQGMFTKLAYGSSVKKMANATSEFPVQDIAHANADYGEIILSLAIERAREIDKAPQTKPHVAHPELEVGSSEQSAQAVKEPHPYRDLPAYCFWKKTVSDRTPEDIDCWYRKKFEIDGLRIAAAGSCFAQHLGNRLRASGFSYLDVEPAPEGLPVDQHQQNGYGIFSARYGNIYTTRQLLQLVQRATGSFKPMVKFWERADGYVDPFRPNIPAQAYSSSEQVEQAQKSHLESVRDLFSQTDLFVFTLGLTETWAFRWDGAVYPLAPGVSGGSFDPSLHQLVNLTYQDIVSDFEAFVKEAHVFNPDMKFLLTVSPVPLMATARSDTQVAVATMHSKSILRAAAGQLALDHPFIDYFPSFEIISSHVSRGKFFEADMRSVANEGVDHVMRQFFREHHLPENAGQQISPESEEDIFCDEELLDAFSEGSPLKFV